MMQYIYNICIYTYISVEISFKNPFDHKEENKTKRIKMITCYDYRRGKQKVRVALELNLERGENE